MRFGAISMFVAAAAMAGLAIAVPVAAVGLLVGAGSLVLGGMFMWSAANSLSMFSRRGVQRRKAEQAARRAQGMPGDAVEGAMRAVQGYLGQWGMPQAGMAMANGVPATVTLLRVSDTGGSVNDNPIVDVEVQVSTDDGRPPFTLTRREVVPRLVMGRLYPGTLFRGLADRYSPTLFSIDWQAAGVTPGAPYGTPTPRF